VIGVYLAPDSMLDAGQRSADRRVVRIPGRMTWRDSSGTLRFVSVMTRDLSEHDVYVECQAPTAIPLYRLVHFQVERGARACEGLPAALKEGKVLSAIYRVGPYQPATGTPQGFALRFLVEPKRARATERKPKLAVANG
jgi:hypothetical protein